MKNILSINKAAGGAIPRGSVVKFGAADDTVVVAAAATDLMIGILNQANAAVTDDRVDVLVMGIGNGLAGGTITRGDQLTSNAAGALITTITNLQDTIGTALVSAVAGDLFPVLVTRGQVSKA